MRQPIIPRKLWLGVGLLLVISFFGAGLAAAQEDESPVVVTTGSPIHPTFPLLDAAGENVLDTGAPVSTMTTCGACHDAEFIAEHSFHADAGLSQFTTVGDVFSAELNPERKQPFDMRSVMRAVTDDDAEPLERLFGDAVERLPVD